MATPSLVEWLIGGTSLGGAIVSAQKLWERWERRRERWRKTREQKLQAWHDELDERERTLDAGLKAEVAELKAAAARQAIASTAQHEQTTALRLAFELVAAELRTFNPGSSALIRAEQLLQAAFPISTGPLIPPDMNAQLDNLQETKGAMA